MTVDGVRFAAQQTGTLVLDDATVLARFTAGDGGAFSMALPIGRSIPAGVHTISAVGPTGSGAAAVLASTSLTVIAAASPTQQASASSLPTPFVNPEATPTPTTAPSPPSTVATARTPAPAAPAGGTGAALPAGPAPTGKAVYVATNGSNANPGTLARPMATPAHAANVASAGTTIYLRGGTYGGFDVRRSGLTFAPYPGESVVIRERGREAVVDFKGVSSGALRDMTVIGSQVTKGTAIKINESSGVSITGTTVRDSVTWGIVVVRSSGVLLENNDVSGTANAIEERYASDLVIRGNRIHSNTTMVDSGRGREGINFYKSTGPVTIVGNQLWDNGTHFEVYGASNLTFSGNVTWNGQVMETGTDGPACDNIRYVRNIGYRGGTTASGMILRCASNMLVAHNTFDGFDQFAFDIVDGTLGTPYGGSIAGLRVVNNIVVGGRAFSIDSALPASVKIDYNLVNISGSTAKYGNYVAYVAGKGNFKTLGELSAATGYQVHGVGADPRFVNRAKRDYRLLADSPAIDRGLSIGFEFSGAAPDLGRNETR